MIEMPVRPTLGYMSTGHSISGAGLLTPLGVGTIETRVTKVIMGNEWLADLCSSGVSVVAVL